MVTTSRSQLARPLPLILVHVFLSVLLGAGVIASPDHVWADAKPSNLAATAAITASSEYSADYLAEFVADHKIPAGASGADTGKAWCAKGHNHPKGVWLAFTWPTSVAVSEVVYFGRTAFEWQENWKEYEVYVDAAESAIASGVLLPGHGPQRIALPGSVTVKKLTLKFLSSYGGSNPGASEIQVLDGQQPAAFYASFSPPPKTPTAQPYAQSRVPES